MFVVKGTSGPSLAKAPRDEKSDMPSKRGIKMIESIQDNYTKHNNANGTNVTNINNNFNINVEENIQQIFLVEKKSHNDQP